MQNNNSTCLDRSSTCHKPQKMQKEEKKKGVPQGEGEVGRNRGRREGEKEGEAAAKEEGKGEEKKKGKGRVLTEPSPYAMHK